MLWPLRTWGLAREVGRSGLALFFFIDVVSDTQGGGGTHEFEWDGVKLESKPDSEK